MTVRELIAELHKFDGDIRVYTPGFDECAYDDLGPPWLARMVRDVGQGGHCGQHDIREFDDEVNLSDVSKEELGVIL